jgi:hypothetical protein
MPVTSRSLDAIRAASEASLYYFARSVLNLPWLTPALHKDMADFMSDPATRRKLTLVPRDCAKTTLMKSLALHMLIQPEAANIYFPGTAGIETRILICGETRTNAQRHVRNIETVVEKNTLFKTLWPHVLPGSKWSEQEMQLLRNTNYSEPTIEALGTDSAIASRHVDVLFKDDIYTFEAMMSPAVSARVNLWHLTTEAILDETENSRAMELITGTPWSAADPYYKIILDSLAASAEGIAPEFHIYRRSIIENNESIWPQRFPLARIKRIENRLRGTGLFSLNYMCSYASNELNDLRADQLREFTFQGGTIIVKDNE